MSAGQFKNICVASAMLALGFGLCAASPALAQSGAYSQASDTKSTSKSGNTKKSKKKSGGKSAQVTPIGKTDPGWGETGDQRAARLSRECKGKPNAGACEGFGG
jgi:hypothetical protein